MYSKKANTSYISNIPLTWSRRKKFSIRIVLLVTGGCFPTGHSSLQSQCLTVEGAKLAKSRNVFLFEDEALHSL